MKKVFIRKKDTLSMECVLDWPKSRELDWAKSLGNKKIKKLKEVIEKQNKTQTFL